ncbi:MAG: hypothetical protein Q9169_007684 [Polycauliona sp. 2 TL-2023]
MAFNTSEGTLLASCKMYLGKASKDLSDKGIKVLGELDQFKGLLQRIVRVSPLSLEKESVDLQEAIDTDREKRTIEKKKRKLEAEAAGDQRSRRAKRQKSAVPAADCATHVGRHPISKRASVDDNSNTSIVREATTGNDASCLGSPSDNTNLAKEAPSNPIAEVACTPISSLMPNNNHRPASGHQETLSEQHESQHSSETSTPQASSLGQPLSTDATSAVNLPLLVSPPSNASAAISSRSTNDTSTSRNPSTSNPDGCNDSIALISTHPQPRNALQSVEDLGVVNNHFSRSTEGDREMAIFAEDDDMRKLLRDRLKKEVYPKFMKQIHDTKLNEHIQKVLGLCPMLLFDRVKDSLLEFTVQRRERPGSRAPIGDIGVNTEPDVVADVLSSNKVDTSDVKLHRIFQQIMLKKTIDNKIAQGYIPANRTTMSQIPQAEFPTYYIEEMASKRFEGQAKRIKEEAARLKRDRLCGFHWSNMMRELGGTGILFVFVFAEISRNKIAQEFNNFQRACLVYIINQLPSIRGLIQCFDEISLEAFCQKGRLSDEIERKLQAAKGPEVIFSESAKEDAEDEDEFDDEESDDNEESGDDEEPEGDEESDDEEDEEMDSGKENNPGP